MIIAEPCYTFPLDIINRRDSEIERILNEIHRRFWEFYRSGFGIISRDGTVDIITKDGYLKRVNIEEIGLKTGEINCYQFCKELKKWVKNLFRNAKAYIAINFASDKRDYYMPHATLLIKIGDNYFLYDGLRENGIVGRPIEKEDIKGEIEVKNSFIRYII